MCSSDLVDITFHLLGARGQGKRQQRHAAQQAASDTEPGRAHDLFLAGAFLARPRDQLIEDLEKAVVVDAAIGANRH